MRRRASLAALSAAGLGLLAGPAGAGTAPRPVAQGQPMPWPAALPLLDGGTLGAAQLQGQAVVAVIWTITCPFCRRHNQHVERLHRAARAAGLPLTVLGIARESDAAAVRRYAQQQGYSFPITLAHESVAPLITERKAVPMTAVVARDGRLRQVLPGEMFEEDVMELLQLARAPAPAR